MKDQKLAAIVFTDIVGYTKRMEADEQATMELLARQREIIFPLVKEFGGEVIKELGDGLLMMFTSANRAVRFAIAMQDKLKDEELTVRAGIHIGDVIFEEGDVFGSAVNIAARIEPLAPHGGICISGDVRSQIRNQKDIITASAGKKELKGVNEPVEIYRVVQGQPKEAEEALPFFKDLWKRRVIQITAIYLVAAYLVRLAVGYLVTEYLLSPYLTSLVWYILLSLLPSIILVSYFHGRRGVTRWSKVELIGLPVNVMVAILVMVFVFKGKDLGAMTTTVTVENEDGDRIEKVVLKNEFRKKIFIFNMENVSGDTSLDLLQYSIPEMTEYDLSQDLLLSSVTATGIYSSIAEAGYEDPVGLPITLMKKFAEQRHMNYFMFGELDRQEGLYTLDVKLYETRLTRLVEELSVQAEDPFTLVDKLSIKVKQAMGLPESHISETVDLPISEIFTDSERALYYYTLAMKENALNNWEGNVRYMEYALREDPDFALAYVTMAVAYLNVNKVGDAMDALQSALDLPYKLPERQLFIAKYINYLMLQEAEKAMAVVKMWVELYPDDIIAHSMLAQRYALRNMFREAIKEYKEILRLDPEQYNILMTLGEFYLYTGDLDSSLIYYQKYADQFPQQAVSHINLGDYYREIADLEAAREHYKTALLLADPAEKVSITLDMAHVLINEGSFDLAYKQCMDALSISRTALDSARTYNLFQHYHILKGQAKRSLEFFLMKMDKFATILPPKDLLSYRAIFINPYILAREIDQAKALLDDIALQLEPPLDKLVPFGYMFIYVETGEIEKAEEAMAGAEELIKGFGQESLMEEVYSAKGKLNESKSDYQAAIQSYRNLLEINRTNYLIHSYISRCYRELKDYESAEEEAAISLKYRPFNPIASYEAALLYLDQGDEEKGREHLQRAVDIWKDADPDYEKARLAREKLAEI
jgi:class 3 adenylate cyclase/tetratricopeptide (TPR) repeat protein